ncbi:MAG: Crp/Fnr family transcriptional regulator [Candidatus Rokubacteria bacterium]|nr:Crp/Fnr family transcriptional regulator [Candidatus Rokubacteria bacterium]
MNAGRGGRAKNRRAPETDVKVLQRVRYFASLSEAELRELAGCCASRQLGAGEILFEEGQSCSGLFIVSEGKVEVRQVSPRGREQVFHTEGPGATLGEGPLFDRGGFIATAVAIEPTRVLGLPRADLLDLCRRRPAVALAILEALARRLRGFAEIVADLAFRPVTERLARHLEAAAGVHPVAPGAVVALALTHTQLAARLGTVRELVARALARLEETGVIRRERGRVVIRDPARLAALARGEG